jgi:protein-tyrosine-phosphatase
MKNCDYLIAFDESNRDEIISTSKRERTFKIVTVDELFS